MALASNDLTDPDPKQWHGLHVLIGITGGIASFKTANVVSHLTQCGAAVRVIMTGAATKFVSPLTFESLSGAPVVTSVWQTRDHHDAPHITAAQWADLMIIAPATADNMAKLATGLSDDIVTLCACALARQTPVLLAPAMNEQMWQNPITKRNLNTLREVLRYSIVGPDTGWQACRTIGAGRMSEPQVILAAAAKLINRHQNDKTS